MPARAARAVRLTNKKLNECFDFSPVLEKKNGFLFLSVSNIRKGKAYVFQHCPQHVSTVPLYCTPEIVLCMQRNKGATV